MADQERVLKGLYAHGYHDCRSCPYWGAGRDGYSDCTGLAREAYSLLKAQQPRVLTLDDIATWVRQKPMDREPIYVEVKDLLGAWGAWMVDEIASYLPETDLSGELYGKTWRCWSARPTDEQRKKVEWDD